MSSADRRLADRSLAEILDAFAERAPTPGGGTAAAVAAALAAALTGMAAAYAEDRAALEEAAALRDRAMALAEAEMRTFLPVIEAQRLDRADPERPARIAQALSDAAGPPLEIAGIAADAAVLAARQSREGKPALAGDATAGAVLAEAACRAALRLAEYNLVAADRGRDGPAPDPRFADVAALAGRAAAARDEALG